MKYSLLEDDTEFIEYLSFVELQNEYRIRKRELCQDIERRYKEEESSLRSNRLEAIETDKSHRMVLNACIFPFSQEGPLSKFGYYFIRASPLSELGVKNLDFLLFHPGEEVSAIFGEAKSQVNSPDKVVDETKKRIKTVHENIAYVGKNYFKKLDPELEFVLGVSMSDAMELTKKIMKRGGEIKVWSTGIQLSSMRPELSFVRPWEGNEIGKTMFHNNKILNQHLSHVEISWDFKSIFPDSHIFAKLSLLAWVGEKEDGSFMFDDLLEIVKEELEYIEIDRIRKETEYILSVAEQIGFIEKINESQKMYKIKSRAKKADTKEEEIKRRWISYSIEKEKEADKAGQLEKLQDEFREKRSKQKSLSDYS